jgi:hypothetical protein
LFFLYKRKLNNKHKELESAQQALAVLENLYLENDGMKGEIAVLLLNKLQISKKITLLKELDKKEEFLKLYKELSAILSNESSIKNEIYTLLNQRYSLFILSLKSRCPQLSDKFILLCCLLKAQYSTEEIALLSGYDINSIPVTKNRLYKQLGFNKYKDFLLYINDPNK